MMIVFDETIEKSRFYDPNENEYIKEKITIRNDPLTRKSCRILDKPLPISRDVDIDQEIIGGFCPFCPDKIEDIGARDCQVLNNELLERGDAVLLSNISPYAKRSLVIRLTEEHYLPLGRFKERHFTDALSLVTKYVERSSDDKYATVMMNYLKPAGSSIVHPHIQFLMSDEPMDYQNRIIKAGREYYEKHHSNYWRDLLEEERDRKRYIGKIGVCEWKTPFAPRGLEHIQGISLENFSSMKRKSLKNISTGIVNTLEYYADQDLNSFNLSILIPPKGDIKRFATVIDIVARSALDKYYWCDVFALSKLQDEAYSNKYPEDIAKEARAFFG